MLTNQPTDIVTPSSLPLLFLVNFPHGHYNHLGHVAYSRARWTGDGEHDDEPRDILSLADAQ